jgi:hypothetical protein
MVPAIALLPRAMSPLPEFATFEALALAQGYDEVTERQWPALAELATHTHPFAVQALVVQGEMWLTEGEGVAASTRHLRRGDRFVLAMHAPHAERYGAEGATYWVARRHQART